MKIKIKRKTYYIVTILLIFLLTVILLYLYTYNSNDNLKKVAKTSFEKDVYQKINSSLKYVLTKKDFTDILTIHKNNNGEILYVDYNLQKSYIYLDEIASYLEKTFSSSSFILDFPFLVGSNNLLFNNFGPKIKVQINYVNSILFNIETKITNYGLNNALVEAYIKISIEGLIITPVSEEKNIINYDMLISSKVINGRVPSLYGDYISSNSSIKNIPIN